MSLQSTLLSVVISRMDRWQTIATIEEQFKVRDLDDAIRTWRRKIQLPWALKKGTLRIFDDVLEYPVASDHDELAYLDTQKGTFYEQKARYRYTSLQQFFEDPDNRNTTAEIWDQGTKFLGVRYKDIQQGSQLLNNAEDVDDYSVSGDATSVTKDTVVFKKGNASMRVAITNSSGTATVKNDFTSSFTDGNYKRKYHFKWIYLDSVPTSIALRFQVNDTNYLETTGITTQFSGQALKADDWNLIAHDLNTATETGTISTSSLWASEKVILTGAATGTYYVDDSHLRAWDLQDYWYYSLNSVLLNGSSVADQQFFYNDSDVYSTDSSLVGDDEWIDIVMYEAMLTSLGDKENDAVFSKIQNKLSQATEELFDRYPSLNPAIITNVWRFGYEFNKENDTSYGYRR